MSFVAVDEAPPSVLDELPLDEFLERLLDLEDLDAAAQIKRRRGTLSKRMQAMIDRRAQLKTRIGFDKPARREYYALGDEYLTTGYDLGKLREALKEINQRLSQASWQRAVTAIFGSEGYHACREWMMSQGLAQ